MTEYEYTTDRGGVLRVKCLADFGAVLVQVDHNDPVRQMPMNIPMTPKVARNMARALMFAAEAMEAVK